MKYDAILGACALGAALLFGSVLAEPGAVASDRWLEAPHSEKALRWAHQQSEASKRKLTALPGYEQVKVELAEVMHAGPSEPKIVLAGPRALRLLRDADHPQGLLQVALRDADGVPSAWETVLDIGGLRGRDHGLPLQLQTFGLDSACLPPEYTRCLLRLSPGGGDEVEIREFDLQQRRFVEQGFHTGKSRGFAQWMGPDLVLIQHAIGNAPKTAAGWPATAQLWQRGTPLTSAAVVFRAQEDDTLLQLHAVGSGALRRGVVVRTLDYATFEIHLVDHGGRLEKVDLPRKLKPMGVQAITNNHLVVQLAADDEGWNLPAEALLAYAVHAEQGQPRVATIHAPSPDEFIASRSDIAASGSGVVFVVTQALEQRVMQATPTAAGWSIREIPGPEAGETITVDGGAGGNGDFLLTTSGFLTPTRMELYRPDRSRQRLAADPERFDASGYTTRIGSAVSRDGTVVDYYVLEPRTPRPGAQPTLMTGYGAFGISIRPGYFDSTVGGPAFKLWLDRGGSLVIPAIRGGGDRGAAWHHAAVREHRQRSYDDFIAVAERLVESGYTQPGHLGVFGMSNGGLLAATVGIQRPDMFSAVISDVPLTDLLRMKYMGMGAAWLNEYGDPDDPGMAEVLKRYSPLHNVRADATYPPFLITVSTEDNRVGPGHARKLAARLASVGAPVYFIEEQEGGHGVSDPLRNPELMALRMTFLIHYLAPTQERVQ